MATKVVTKERRLTRFISDADREKVGNKFFSIKAFLTAEDADRKRGSRYEYYFANKIKVVDED